MSGEVKMIAVTQTPQKLKPCSRAHRRKVMLVELGLWGLLTGRGWVVRAAEAAIAREGLQSA
jgi:hypothetical protein